MTAFEIRLVGGPFDGDQGIIDALPGILWAWQCRGARCLATPEHCRKNSSDVHWTLEEQLRALTEEGWWRFVYADGLASPLGQQEAQQLLTEVA